MVATTIENDLINIVPNTFLGLYYKSEGTIGVIEAPIGKWNFLSPSHEVFTPGLYVEMEDRGINIGDLLATVIITEKKAGRDPGVYRDHTRVSLRLFHVDRRDVVLDFIGKNTEHAKQEGDVEIMIMIKDELNPDIKIARSYYSVEDGKF